MLKGRAIYAHVLLEQHSKRAVLGVRSAWRLVQGHSGVSRCTPCSGTDGPFTGCHERANAKAGNTNTWLVKRQTPAVRKAAVNHAHLSAAAGDIRAACVGSSCSAPDNAWCTHCWNCALVKYPVRYQSAPSNNIRALDSMSS